MKARTPQNYIVLLHLHNVQKMADSIIWFRDVCWGNVTRKKNKEVITTKVRNLIGRRHKMGIGGDGRVVSVLT